MILLGIDPGANTGLALYRDGKLVGLRTVEPLMLIEVIKAVCPDAIAIEDSRLQGAIWHSGRGQAKIARDVGRIDGWCDLVESAAKWLGCKFYPVSPKGKGAKLDAAAFRQVTGWVGQTNQHERDAGMVGWQLRKAGVSTVL